MKANNITYKSFCWSIGTTSFRTKDFNSTIEKQLQLLNSFWQIAENADESWSNNNALQDRYYLHLKGNGLVKGDAARKNKDAREKTSGLVDIGLIDDERRLTEAGEALLKISSTANYTSDNSLQIDNDSFLYLKQLFKTYNNVDGNIVRPYIVLSYLLCSLGYLTNDEFTYLLPLCTTEERTVQIKDSIIAIRANNGSVDDIVISTLMDMDNYQQALSLLLSSSADEDLICCIGLNRKSRRYDVPYYRLYEELKKLFLNKDLSSAITVFNALKEIKTGNLWRKYLFSVTSSREIERKPSACLKQTLFTGVSDEQEFKTAFFKAMHLFKAKAMLNDYLDLNMRYFKITDTIIFEDGKVRFDIIPKHFINPIIDELFTHAFSVSDNLYQNCALEEITPCLVINEDNIIRGINDELGGNIRTMAEAKQAVLRERLSRFDTLIDSRFSDETLITLLDKFESRSDDEIRSLVTDNADIPTIFEYILGIIWYKISDRTGNILKYMNLSLEADLLPKTHAGGGKADIVYQYSACQEYPEHSILLEATLAEGTNQRRNEMEPVSRHLGDYILKTGNTNSYCVFATTYLDRNVVSDFRGRKLIPYYGPDYEGCVDGMKIIPLQTGTLKHIIRNSLNYKRLYSLFEEAYNSTEAVPIWYSECIERAVNEDNNA